MVLVDLAVASPCEKEYRPLGCGCTEHIKGGRYVDGRDHHPPVLHGRRPIGHCQQAFRCPPVCERDGHDWPAVYAQRWPLSRLLPLAGQELPCVVSQTARTLAASTPLARPR